MLHYQSMELVMSRYANDSFRFISITTIHINVQKDYIGFIIECLNRTIYHQSIYKSL